MNDSVNKSSKVSGIVKWFSDEKGFGFIVCDGIVGTDVFVHKQQLQKSNVPAVKEGDRVSCLINKGVKGMYATDIEMI